MDKLIRNRKILVTGGAGFIGSNLIEALLSQGNEVVCLDNFATGKQKNVEPFFGDEKFKLVEGDIRNPDDCRRAAGNVNIVLHQAALGSVPRSVKDPVTTNSVNIDGFLNMLVAARDAGVKRFVYASSSSVYGDHRGLPKVEDETGNLLSPYAVTKKVNELYAGVFASLYGMEVIGLRYFNVFGKRQDPDGQYAAVIPRFIKSLIAHQRPEIYGDGLQSRDFTFVDNVVHANQAAALASAGALGTCYNIAFGERITLTELFFILRDNLAQFDPVIGSIEPLFVGERQGDIKHSLASIDKAGKLMGYEPQTSVREGLKKAINWYWENLR